MVGPYSSGEELVIKTRKPYTITKQRERWTEEEHNRFLEALKLYGRAWQRIEEHIGTKTAVQIRSHAQKFFTKLEKEAIAKGVPVGLSIDIEIPPPRPKRKPSNPYPRKTSAGAYTSQGGTEYGTLLTSGSFFSSDEDKRHLEEKTPPKNHCGDENIRNVEERQDEDICSQTFMGFLENASTHLSSANESSLPREEPPRNSCSSDEYLPLTKELTNQDETIESFITFEPKGKQKFDKDDAKTKILESGGTSNTTNLENSHHSHEKLVQSRKVDELSQPENFSQLPADEVQATQNYPRHVPVHILDGSLGMKAQQESTDPAASPKHHNNAPTSSIPHPFPTLHPLFPPIHNNEEDYQPFLHIPSAFSSLIVSALLQNPAAHAAASFAASFWPCSNIESSPDSAAGSSPSNQMNSAPSMVAIAAATVAAASAWWAAHGLLPYSAPFHSGFTEQWHSCFYNSHPGFQGQQLDQKHFKSMEEQNSASKSPTLSISESEESEGAKMNTGVTDADTRQQSVPPTELHDSSKIKSRKQLERSSCGSNTPSSSEVETNDQVKHEKCTDESREPDASHIGSDSCNRRSRSSSNVNDSWKLVSEVGRMAFQALFSREVLPQSFSAPHDQKYDRYQQSNSQDNRNTDERRNLHETEAATSLQLDLNRTSVICSDHQGTKNNIFFIGDNNVMLGQGKLKAHRTGFKPYKRCSMEAKESKVASSNCPGEERRPKRICLQGESST